MTTKPENFNELFLRSLADDLAVADPRWAPTVDALRNAADELLSWRTHGHYIPKERLYDPNFGDDKVCQCGHPYYRHFDTYEEMYPCGCKYCECGTFKPVDPQP